MVSIIIPVFNEEDAVEDTILRLQKTLSAIPEESEIIVVDDGSEDRTHPLSLALAPTLSKGNLSIRVVHHEKNQGNGAAIMSGITAAKGTVLGTVDADGTYPIEEFPRLLKEMRMHHADMVVGTRHRQGSHIPLTHLIAKTFLRMFASTLLCRRIPDLNSGMRLFTRDLAEHFMNLYPKRFSFHITLTVAAIAQKYHVRYIDIDYFRRSGMSKLSRGILGYYNFCKFLLLIPYILVRAQWK